MAQQALKKMALGWLGPGLPEMSVAEEDDALRWSKVPSQMTATKWESLTYAGGPWESHRFLLQHQEP